MMVNDGCLDGRIRGEDGAVSVFAGRVFLAITGSVFLVAVAWAGWAWPGEGPDAAGLGVLLALAVIAAVLWIAAAVLTVRFVEATVDERSVTLRRVWGRSRTIDRASVDEVVLFSLILPTRLGTTATRRVLLRRKGAQVAAFTPRAAGFAAVLARCGWDPVVIADPLTPPEATRRYPGSVGRGERLAHLLPVGAIIVGATAAVCVVAVALGR
ncbi:hypothetical protein ACFY9N_16715 [Microbacterium sp. NPDC008134]|uniref:hypothetical protein n=1 Tax=Microbacterium sp. NPDC008134 TaxID=3364183 RepID=UPI0036EB05B6